MKDKLAGVHPDLVARVVKICSAMAALGYPMMVTDGVRTDAEQQALYAKGRTVPGLVVTQLDGVSGRSKHQIRSDGYGRAVDCCFMVHGLPSWDPTMPWNLYGAMAKQLGLEWGGNWITFADKPHIELPERRKSDPQAAP